MNPKEIKKFLIDEDLIQARIAEDLEVKPSLVSQVISGKKKSKRVINYLISKGCPEQFLHNEKTAA